jgi:hypothetical protein
MSIRQGSAITLIDNLCGVVMIFRSAMRTILLLALLLFTAVTGAAFADTGLTWSTAPPMAQARMGHAMVALPTGPSGLGLSAAPGKVMVIGGFNSSPLAVPTGTPLASCEIYDPQSNAWVPAAPHPVAGGWRWGIALGNGMVLVVGGAKTPTEFISSSHLYDPKTNRWIETGSLPRGLANAHAFMRPVILPNGQVLIAGGVDETSFPNPSFKVPNPTRASYVLTLNASNPAASSWTQTRRVSDGAITQMPEGRTTSAIVMLANGMVLNAGGLGPLFKRQEAATNTAILFDYRTGVWTSAPPMPAVYGLFEDELVTSYPNALGSRWAPYSEVLPDGRVLIAGGVGGLLFEAFRRSAVIYDGSIGTWSAATPMQFYRPLGGLSAQLQKDGNILFVGPGYSFDGTTVSLHDVTGEVFLSGSKQWRLVPTANGPQADGSFDSFESKLVKTGNGNLQIAGGADLATDTLGTSHSWILEP